MELRLLAHRGRIAAIAAAVTVSTAAVTGCGARFGGTPQADAHTKAIAATPLSGAAHSAQPAGPASGTAQPSQPPLRAGQVGTLAQVPWGDITPGWALAEYTTGSSQVAAPVTLYIVDPEGGLYQIYRWPATTQPWTLVAWSGDRTRVLLQQWGGSQPTLHQLTMATGQITTFTLPSDVSAVLGYTRPDGENILVAENGIVRYSLTGAFQARLSQGGSGASVVSSVDGRTEVVSGANGVELVANSGAMVRQLPVPGADGSDGGCRPVRWWSAADVLASCMPQPGPDQFSAAQLWLVPVSGGAPTALTPRRTTGPDFGDADAWQLPTGLYLQAEAGCGPPFVAKQLAAGGVQPISPATVVIATAGNRMLVQQDSECAPGSSLGWLNPATTDLQRVLSDSAKSTGVVSAVPFDGDGQQPQL